MRGGGGFRGGGGGGRGGGGRRSDIVLKHDIALIGHLDNGLGFYRFAYKGSDTAYVGVMAQEVQRIRPDAVVRGKDGYLRVFYDKLGAEVPNLRSMARIGRRGAVGRALTRTLNEGFPARLVVTAAPEARHPLGAAAADRDREPVNPF